MPHQQSCLPCRCCPDWDSLPQHVTSVPSMTVFRGCLKAFLFRLFFPWLLPQVFRACTVTGVIFRHLNHSFTYLHTPNKSFTHSALESYNNVWMSHYVAIFVADLIPTLPVTVSSSDSAAATQRVGVVRRNPVPNPVPTNPPRVCSACFLIF